MKKSNNFGLLSKIDKHLYYFSESAEKLLFQDGQATLVKLRCFCERCVGLLLRKLHRTHIKLNYNDSLLEKLKDLKSCNVIPQEIIGKLHLLRMKGNKAAHGNEINFNESELIDFIKEAYLISKWLYLSYFPNATYPDFIIPINDENSDPYQENHDNRKEVERLNQLENRDFEKNRDLTLQLSVEQINFYRESFKKDSENSKNKFDLEFDRTLDYLKLSNAYAGYQLTEGQTQLVKELEHFFTESKKNVFLLKGYAGTGKTFITKGLTDYLDVIGITYKLAALTGKAAKVIKSKTGKDAGTIHSLIYSMDDLVEYTDENDPTTYKFYANLRSNIDPSDTVYIIDESSMLSNVYSDSEFIRFGSGCLLNDLMKFINIDQNDHHKKIIFIGDNAQLPPIGMNISPALNKDYLLKHFNLSSDEFELTEVVRQKAESHIIKNALKLRESLRRDEFNRISFDTYPEEVLEIKETEFLGDYLESCDGKINGESIVIAYSNADVANYNKSIRQHFFPNQETICQGDKILVNRNTEINGFRIYNGDFGLVKNVSDSAEVRNVLLRKKDKSGVVNKSLISLSFRDVDAGFRDENGNPIWLKTKIIENLLYSTEPSLSSDEQKALYIDFCIRHPDISYKKNKNEFRNALMSDPYFCALQVKFGYAITCHKAQGSEWNKAFVKCNTHKNPLSKDYFRWIYTAITRGANKLFLIDPPKLKLGSGLKLVGMTMNNNSRLENNVNDVESRCIENDSILLRDLSDLSKEIYFKINKVVSEFGALISNVIQNQYHNIYEISLGEQYAKIRVYYNAKSKITNIDGLTANDLTNKVIKGIDFLKGNVISLEQSKPVSHIEKLELSQTFLNEYKMDVVEIMNENDIVVADVSEIQYALRFTFKKDKDIAVIDIYYNGKHQFQKIHPVYNKSTTIGFVEKVTDLLQI